MTAQTFGDNDLSACLDGEISPERRDAIERWLRATPEAAARVETWRRQNDIVRGRFARIMAEPVPSSIWPTDQNADTDARKRIKAISDPDAPIQVGQFDRQRRDQRGRRLFFGAGAFALGAAAMAVLAISTGYAPMPRGPGARSVESTTLARSLEALAARALDANRTFLRDPSRPVEIAAGDARNLSEFLSRRIGLNVNAPTLDDQGTRMLGARLTPGDLGPAGFIVYEDPDGVRFGLFISRAPGLDPVSIRIVERRTSAVALWIARGASFALTGAADPSRLLRLANAMEAKAPASAIVTSTPAP